ncbi:hypothetical protein RFI_32182, partial [Reticulomyxa filosa]
TFSIVVGIINSFQIQVFNYLYVYFANFVNEWEGHRLQEEWFVFFLKVFIIQFYNQTKKKKKKRYNNLVVKRIFFFIINSFNSLFYLLYISPAFDDNDAKLKAVRIQLLTLFFTAIITQNAMEVMLPSLFAKMKKRKAQRARLPDDTLLNFIFTIYIYVYCKYGAYTKKQESTNISQAGQAIRQDWELIMEDITYQLQCGESPSVLDNSAEIVIQYGYVMLFAVVFPLMPLFSILNNFVEFAVDFHNYTHMQRPIPHAASGIGVWKQVISSFTIAAVFNNTAILMFRSNVFDKYSFSNSFEQKKDFYFVVEKHLLMGPQTTTKLNQRLRQKRLEHEQFHKDGGNGHGHSGHDDDDDDDHGSHDQHHSHKHDKRNFGGLEIKGFHFIIYTIRYFTFGVEQTIKRNNNLGLCNYNNIIF